MRPTSPYLTKTARIAAPLFIGTDDQMKVGIHYFHFSNSFILTNTGFNLNQVQSIIIKRNNIVVYNSTVSGLQNMVIPVPITCSEDGYQDIEITLQIPSRNNIYKLRGNCTVEPLATPCRGFDTFTYFGYPYDGGYGVNFRAKATATIYYADVNCATKRITKPIIFVDGFDPGNKQHAAEIWKLYLNKAFTQNDSLKFLGDELLAAGYDIIIFDPIESDSANYIFTGGTSLIENNGLVLAKFLEEFYAQHQSTIINDYVVVGASMGGIIARFGLAWMETNNKQHHTRLFISFDSPQNGAQIPLGLQQLVDAFTQYSIARNFSGVKEALHRTAAARQMILHHSSQNSETQAADPWRAKLLANLASVGNYPTQCRNIAIIDGGKNGVLKNIVPNPNPNNVEAIAEKQLTFDIGIKRRFNPNCTQKSCYKLHAQVYAQTASTRSKTFEFYLNTNNLLLIAGFGTTYLNYAKYAVANNNTSLDIAPGSRLRKDPLERIGTLKVNPYQITGLLAGKLKVETNIIKFNNFVPTFSALDYQFTPTNPFNNYKSYQNETLNRCSGTVPFDTAYVYNQDLDHVEIDANLANAFKNEVYFPKPKSVCADECPDFLTLSSPLSSTAIGNYKAAKSITLNPNFMAPNGSLISADIGCLSASNYFKTKYNNSIQPISNVSTLSLCPFDWEFTMNKVTCLMGFTNFKVFVNQFMDVSTYAEFSIDGTSWNRANTQDFGHEWLLPSNPNQAQTFYARPHNDPTNIITLNLPFCN